MAVKKATDTPKVRNADESVQFTKSQILCAEKYSNRRDLVDALLDEDKSYTIETVDKMIDDFKKGKVK